MSLNAVRKGVAAISSPDWNAIRSEYISGDISQRKLAAKYGVSINTMLKRANREKWNDMRTDAYNKAVAAVQQKTVEKMSDNASVAADLKKKLLKRLQRIEEKYPLDATEVKTKVGNSVSIYRIKDLTAAYKDLTDDMNLNANTEPVRIIIDV